MTRKKEREKEKIFTEAHGKTPAQKGDGVATNFFVEGERKKELEGGEFSGSRKKKGNNWGGIHRHDTPVQFGLQSPRKKEELNAKNGGIPNCG